MPTFTIHEPPPRKTAKKTAQKPGSVNAPERLVFVRDGFHFWAFLLAPLWLLVRRLWLALLIYVVLTIGVGVGLKLAGVSSTVRVVAELMIALGIGFEAASIRRWTLNRRGWKTLGFVVAENAEMAERRFFAAWAGGETKAPVTPPPAPPRYSTPINRGAPSPSDVIGLFPEPGHSPTGASR